MPGAGQIHKATSAAQAPSLLPQHIFSGLPQGVRQETGSLKPASCLALGLSVLMWSRGVVSLPTGQQGSRLLLFCSRSPSGALGL